MHPNANLLGRFAPSPTGPLHMGSLVAAVASYCDIKQRGGRWQVRIDDLDPPRTAPNACESILQTLNAHGLQSDLPIEYQSQHKGAYSRALKKLAARCFFCTCTRKQLAGFSVYPGTCRTNLAPSENASTRILVGANKISFHDLVLGNQDHDLAKEFGDFTIQRKDGLTSYNLATAVDDASAITHVIRGQDLYTTTSVQLHLMQLLGLTPPVYGHIPVLTYADGKKLSKQNFAPALNITSAVENLGNALIYLGMPLTVNHNWTVQQLLEWAINHWDIAKLPTKLRPFSANA
ncbi:MAG: glutamyl-Q tRNA(Asp) synthetase [Candidatus Azotimanducaceae bacterium]|jgi:glutamyl-Q tRNA(Asp) synthetase|tara:strand:- start:5644 stop:6516 length:873 start_codon:yes stop_codon:yes gene_type:complete